MLNELLSAQQALEELGIQLPVQHADIYGAARQGAFEIRLDATPAVGSVSWLESDAVVGLWNLRDGKQNSFPILKPKSPLHALASDHTVRAELEALGRDRKARLMAVLEATDRDPVLDAEPHSAWWSTRDRRLGERREQLNTGTGIDALLQVIDRFKGVPIEDLLVQIDAAIRKAVRNGDIPESAFADLEDLLVGKAKGGRISSKAQLAFDVSEIVRMRPRVLSQAMSAALSAALIATDPHEQADDTCALTGKRVVTVSGPFPTAKLPFLGETGLYNLFAQNRCHERYGMIESRAMPVGVDVSNRLAATLRFLTDADRDGRTWRGFTVGEIPHLLLAYVTEVEDLPDLPIAALFTEDRERSVDFEASAASFFDGLHTGVTQAGVQIISLIKVDDGRKAVSASIYLTVDGLSSAVNRWLAGCANLPSLRVPSPGGEGRFISRPRALYPLSVPNVLTVHWKSDASQRFATKRAPMPSSVALRFFLSTQPPVSDARWVLATTLRNLTPLIVCVGGETLAGRTVIKSAARDTLHAVALLGLTLFMLGIKKEDYVSNTAFLLGRTMRLADVLHAEYSKKVRGDGSGGGMPGRLIGNAQMQSVLTTPVKSLALLSERILLYQGWASTAHDAGIARWALKHLSETAEALADMDLPVRADDEFRAQALLGYLARLPKSDKTGDDPVENEENENGE